MTVKNAARSVYVKPLDQVDFGNASLQIEEMELYSSTERKLSKLEAKKKKKHEKGLSKGGNITEGARQRCQTSAVCYRD